MSLPRENNNERVHPAAQYRALMPLAVWSVVVGAVSVLTFLSWWLAAIPLLGIGLGRKALQRIAAAPGEWTGQGLAKLGIALSVGFWVVGYGWLIFDRASEKPAGHLWLTYELLQPDPNVPTEPIPQSALDLQDKPVYVKGYMKPRRQQTGIKEFVLCPSNGECPFCLPDPKRTEMIRILLQGDMETTFTTHQIGVGGRFQVDPADPSGIPYAIEANYLR